MNGRERFGSFVRLIRMNRGYSLRSFCIAAKVDPSNWSKLERGFKININVDEVVSSLKKGGIPISFIVEQRLRNWAMVANRTIPSDIDDERLIRSLPIFIACNRKLSATDLDELVDLMREHLTERE